MEWKKKMKIFKDDKQHFITPTPLSDSHLRWDLGGSDVLNVIPLVIKLTKSCFN